MKISAQIWSFIVLLAAIVVTLLVLGDVDLDTSVNNAQDTRLPNSYTMDNLAGISGVSMRLPRDWQAVPDPAGQALLLNTSVDEQDVTFLASLVRQAGATVEGLAGEDGTVTSYSGLPASSAVLGSGDNVGIVKLIELEPGNFLRVENATQLSEDQWDALEDDLDAILNSMDVRELAIAPILFEFAELPADWIQVQTNDTTVVQLQAPAGGAQPSALVQLINVPAEEAVAFVTNNLNIIPQDAIVPPDPSVEDLFDVVSDASAESGITVLQPTTAVTYNGLEGIEVIIQGQGVDAFRLVSLDAGDGTQIIGLGAVLTGVENIDAYQQDILTILEGLTYNSPTAPAEPESEEAEAEDADAEGEDTESAGEDTSEPDAEGEDTESGDN